MSYPGRPAPPQVRRVYLPAWVFTFLQWDVFAWLAYVALFAFRVHTATGWWRVGLIVLLVGLTAVVARDVWRRLRGLAGSR